MLLSFIKYKFGITSLNLICLFLGFQDSWFVPSALWTIPLSSGLLLQLYTVKMEPLDGTLVVVAGNHFAIEDVLAQAESLFVGINIG